MSIKKLTCVAVDDEPLALALMKNYIDANENLVFEQSFSDAIIAAAYLKENQVDLLLLDIHMPDISGIELFKQLEHKPMVIFTTAYKDFAFEGFELNAVDYLLKPIEYLRFKKAIDKALEYTQFKNNADTGEEEALFVHSEYKLIKILLKDIVAVESLEDYVKIHLTNGKMILTLMTLKKMQEKLPSKKFVRLHRSFIAALKEIKQVANRKATMSNGQVIPISESNLSAIETWKNS